MARSLTTDFQPNEYSLPSALQAWSQLDQLMANKQVIILLDYDGTLVPICAKPSLAQISEHRKQQLAKLSQLYVTAITSGRPLKEQICLVDSPNIYHIGHYGYEIKLPFNPPYLLKQVGNFVTDIDQAYLQLKIELGKIKGIIIENKKYSLSIHFQLVEKKLINHIEYTVDKIVKETLFLKKFYSKRIFEVRPNIDWDKGSVIFNLIQALNLNRNNVLPIYIGDDVTDEPAFEAIHNSGIGILVSKYNRPTLASYRLKNVDEVWQFLNNMIKRPVLFPTIQATHFTLANNFSNYKTHTI